MAGGVLSRNVPYILSQVSAATSSCSGFVKGLSLLLFIGYCLSYNNGIFKKVIVTPAYIMPPKFCVWTLFTHCFFENSILMLIGDIVAITLCGKLVEPLWGNAEVLLFYCVVNVSTAFLSVVYFILLYWFTGQAIYLFNIEIHGMAGYTAAIIVAVKQLMPDNVLVALPKIGKLRNRNMPLTVLALSILLYTIGMLRPPYPVMYLSGTLSSWLYLRFWQAHSNGSKGDIADHFCFASFFPNVLQPPVAVICNAIFEFFVKVGVCRRPARKFTMANSAPSIAINMPGSSSGLSAANSPADDAERRKQLALKALNERLAKGGMSKSPSAPLFPQSQGKQSKERLIDV
ncbi:transmembrane protein 115 [Galendromus occidentalis]|uniref:Transmembrane protein 115 n=1 Tax=Galendromus occidentalis TaxID=34638 RepID=A0AAJ6VV01_9ACAR|nr:transmembrane protein 115 [Galendromus occidentalis]